MSLSVQPVTNLEVTVDMQRKSSKKNATASDTNEDPSASVQPVTNLEVSFDVERQNPHPSVGMLFSIHLNPFLVYVKLATSFFSLCLSYH